jgi:hypothetical protein
MIRLRRDGEREVPTDAGENPPAGAVFRYVVPEGASGPLEIRIVDADGKVLRHGASGDRDGLGALLDVRPGLHEVVWDLRVEAGIEMPGARLSAYWGGSTIGPKVPPGRYRVEISGGGATRAADFEVMRDPRLTATDADLAAQYALLLSIRDKLSEIHRALIAADAARSQLTTYAERLAEGGNDDLAEAARALAGSIATLSGELHEARARGGADAFNYPPKVNSKLASLESTASYGDARPPQQCYDVFTHLSGIADEGLAKLRRACREEVAALNARIAEAGVAAVLVPSGIDG